MATITIVTTASREEITRVIRELPGTLAGRNVDVGGIARDFRAALGWQFFSMVSLSFETKSRGGVDDAGDSWPRNSAAYLAYGKGPKSSRMGSGQSPMNLPGGPKAHGGRKGRGAGTGMLTKKQLRQWWFIYASVLGVLAQSMPIQEAKSRAAAVAWVNAKRRGAKTLLDKFGNRRDQVLVDKGDLRTSLQIGERVEMEYKPASDQQLYEAEPSRVVVGSRNPNAVRHHRGEGVPERRLWPERFPRDWWRQINGQMAAVLGRIGEMAQRGELS